VELFHLHSTSLLSSAIVNPDSNTNTLNFLCIKITFLFESKNVSRTSLINVYIPFQAFDKFAVGLEEVTQAFGYGMLPALCWRFALLCVKSDVEKREDCVTSIAIN